METEWFNYYNSLEQWIKEQYQKIATSQLRLRGTMLEQNRIFRANFLALKHYEAEMERFRRRTSQNLSDSSRSSLGNTHTEAIPRFRRFTIPHPWRRVVAEIIDMLLLLVFKLVLIYWLSGDSPLMEVSKYFGFNLVSTTPEYRTFRRTHVWTKSGLYKKEVPMSKLERLFYAVHEEFRGSEGDFLDLDLLLIVDHIGRLVGAIVEALFISHSFLGRGPGGATIGKWIMNLKVVSCDEIVPLPDAVDVSPGTQLGFARALVRSMLKSTSFLTLFSFVCMLLFRYHRCTYDLIAGTLVVQPLPNPQPLNDNEHDPNAEDDRPNVPR